MTLGKILADANKRGMSLDVVTEIYKEERFKATASPRGGGANGMASPKGGSNGVVSPEGAKGIGSPRNAKGIDSPGSARGVKSPRSARGANGIASPGSATPGRSRGSARGFASPGDSRGSAKRFASPKSLKGIASPGKVKGIASPTSLKGMASPGSVEGIVSPGSSNVRQDEGPNPEEDKNDPSPSSLEETAAEREDVKTTVSGEIADDIEELSRLCDQATKLFDENLMPDAEEMEVKTDETLPETLTPVVSDEYETSLGEDDGVGINGVENWGERCAADDRVKIEVAGKRSGNHPSLLIRNLSLRCIQEESVASPGRPMTEPAFKIKARKEGSPAAHSENSPANHFGRGPFVNHLGKGSPANRLVKGSQANHLKKGSLANHLGKQSLANQLGKGSPANPLQMGSQANHLRNGSPANRSDNGTPANRLGKGSPDSCPKKGSPANHLKKGSPANQRKLASPSKVRHDTADALPTDEAGSNGKPDVHEVQEMLQEMFSCDTPSGGAADEYAASSKRDDRGEDEWTNIEDEENLGDEYEDPSIQNPPVQCMHGRSIDIPDRPMAEAASVNEAYIGTPRRKGSSANHSVRLREGGSPSLNRRGNTGDPMAEADVGTPRRKGSFVNRSMESCKKGSPLQNNRSIADSLLVDQTAMNGKPDVREVQEMFSQGNAFPFDEKPIPQNSVEHVERQDFETEFGTPGLNESQLRQLKDLVERAEELREADVSPRACMDDAMKLSLEDSRSYESLPVPPGSGRENATGLGRDDIDAFFSRFSIEKDGEPTPEISEETAQSRRKEGPEAQCSERVSESSCTESFNNKDEVDDTQSQILPSVGNMTLESSYSSSVSREEASKTAEVIKLVEEEALGDKEWKLKQKLHLGEGNKTLPKHIGVWKSPWQRNQIAHSRSSDALKIVPSAESAAAGTVSRETLGGKRHCFLPLKERLSGHAGYLNIDFYSLYEATEVQAEAEEIDQAPWEYRDVGQRFLVEKSLESRNWFGAFVTQRGNDRVPNAVCRPICATISATKIPEPGAWSEDWYTTWKSRKDNPNNLVAFARDEIENTGESDPLIISSFSRHETASLKKKVEIGSFFPVRVAGGEHVSRIHPEFTSSLRQSRWRKKYLKGFLFTTD
eukprot:CAMPEP_0172543496 /NCGR_PEP_ID=MMETSP1067-20121228/13876_1 /TAXON_ID=265564 ORGANISM="Thalassiosira punctigera, Strain Tpunct2005C2" /NCGR_SAMPLE_ID=MMETSP1067 /ASSEMBLY_ACC=CAM_ASM_000444 /LENGTH=1124 /DNA_ID=CAMNT_0013329923 /DNA_START=66 /DNA_END=3440 /DNA_ORIENTATION=+